MTLTKDEQQQVDTSVTNNCVCTEMDCVHSKSFRRGVDFALQHLLPGRMEKFAEWVRTRDGNQKMALNDHDWYYDADHDGDLPIPDEELVRQFIQETIKQQQDGKDN